MNLEQMKERSPGAKPAGAGALPGYRLAFRGAARGYYLTLLPEPEGLVPVGVWEVTPEDLEKLDEYEGYPEFYYKLEVDMDFKDISTGEQRPGGGLYRGKIAPQQAVACAFPRDVLS